jgi:hypothetical protein
VSERVQVMSSMIDGVEDEAEAELFHLLDRDEAELVTSDSQAY